VSADELLTDVPSTSWQGMLAIARCDGAALLSLLMLSFMVPLMLQVLCAKEAFIINTITRMFSSRDLCFERDFIWLIRHYCGI